MKRHIFVLACLVSLAGCSSTSSQPATPTSEVEIQSFVKGIYSDMEQEDYAFHNYLSEEFLSLLDRENEITQGEIGTLDYDPLCTCQDSEGIKFKAVTTHFTSPTSARSRVTFSNMGKDSQLELSLLKGTKGWKIDDITDGQGSVTERIRHFIQAPDSQ